MTAGPMEPLLTEEQAAELIGLSPKFLEGRRSRGGGPPFVKISSRAVRYRPSDLRRWVEDRVVDGSADAA